MLTARCKILHRAVSIGDSGKEHGMDFVDCRPSANSTAPSRGTHRERGLSKLERLERQRDQLTERIRREKQKVSAAERKARNHALMVIGGLMVKQFDDGDWKCVDWDVLAEWISRHGSELGRCTADRLCTADATARLREWERASR